MNIVRSLSRKLPRNACRQPLWTFFLAAACLTSLAAISQPSNQPRKADCSAIKGGTLAYVVFDQSPQSERLYEEMKTLACPEWVATNQVRGDFSAGPARAERHPLAFVFEATGKVRQFDDPKAFVAAVNERTRSAPHVAATVVTANVAKKWRVNAAGDLGNLQAP